MAAGAADQGILGGEGGHPGCRGVLLQAENRTLHLVGVALVIDQRVGPELRDPHETRPGDESAATHLFPAAGDVGQQGKPGEVVAGHEALAGQIAVGAEIRVGGSTAGLGGQQQLLLHSGGAVALIRRHAFALRDGVVAQVPSGLFHLAIDRRQ